MKTVLCFGGEEFELKTAEEESKELIKAQTYVGRVWHLLPSGAGHFSVAICGAKPSGRGRWIGEAEESAGCCFKPERVCFECERRKPEAK